MICRLDELWNGYELMYNEDEMRNFSLWFICGRFAPALNRHEANTKCRNVAGIRNAAAGKRNCSAWQSASKYLHVVHHSLSFVKQSMSAHSRTHPLHPQRLRPKHLIHIHAQFISRWYVNCATTTFNKPYIIHFFGRGLACSNPSSSIPHSALIQYASNEFINMQID